MHTINTQCICLDYKIESPRLHYSRFAVSPILSGQANMIGTAIRKMLLSEIQCACITRAHVMGAVHEYSTLAGIRESIHDILVNLQDVVLRADTYEAQSGSISFQGPGIVTANCIQLPSSVRIVDKAQYIARIEKDTQLKMELTVQKRRAWHINSEVPVPSQIPLRSGVFLLDAISTPVRHVNYNVYSLGEGSGLKELLMLEIWTNGSMTPEEVLCDAAWNLIGIFQPFLNLQTQDQPLFKQFSQSNLSALLHQATQHSRAEQIHTQSCLQGVSIDELQLPARISTCLKRAGIHTILQLVKNSEEDLLKIKTFGKRSTHLVVTALQQRFHMNLATCHNEV